MQKVHKIGIDARMYRQSTGGIGTYTQNLLENLAELDKQNEYHIILTKEDKKEYNLKAKNFHPHVVPYPHYSLREQTGFLRFLNKNSFDLVHFTNFNHTLLYRKKFVITIHDLTMTLFPAPGKQSSFFWRQLYHLTLKNGAKKAKKIITDSTNTKRDIIKILKMPKEKVKTILLAAGTNYHPTRTEEATKILENKYKIKGPYILFVSQWRPHKGIEKLISAFEILDRRFKLKDLNLVLTGKPNPDFPQIKARIDNSKLKKRIFTPGFIDSQDMAALYSNAHIFAFPTIYEGFGLNPLEAMACGTPVVASNVSSVPEVCGKAALYFDPKDCEDMALKIYTALTNNPLRDNLIEQGFKNTKCFSWEKTAKQTLEVYREVLEE